MLAIQTIDLKALRTFRNPLKIIPKKILDPQSQLKRTVTTPGRDAVIKKII